MKKQRNHYTPEEKVGILRRHLLEGVPTSEVGGSEGTAEESPPSGRYAVEGLFSIVIACQILAKLVTDGAAKRSQE
jgi:hypothetical protein